MRPAAPAPAHTRGTVNIYEAFRDGGGRGREEDEKLLANLRRALCSAPRSREIHRVRVMRLLETYVRRAGRAGGGMERVHPRRCISPPGRELLLFPRSNEIGRIASAIDRGLLSREKEDQTGCLFEEGSRARLITLFIISRNPGRGGFLFLFFLVLMREVVRIEVA